MGNIRCCRHGFPEAASDGAGVLPGPPAKGNRPAIPARRRLGMGSMVIASEVRASVGIQERGIDHKDYYESRDQKKEKHKQKENP